MKLVHKKKGFSLIEAAIVLGIVGLVIGGIWVAAETVSTNHKINLSNTYQHKIMKDLMHLYKGQQLPTTFTDLTPTLIAANIIPPDMIANGQAKTVWGGGFEVIVPSSTSQVWVNYYDVPQSACVKLVKANVTGIDIYRGRSQEGIVFIMINANTPSLDPSTLIHAAGNLCKLSSPTSIVFAYDVNYIK